jgi:small GTP-binding protein
MLENEILNIKLLTLGESYVGKTTLILNNMNPNIKTTNLERLYPTIGVDYQKKSVTIDNRNINVEIWDTAGQEKFKKITSQYYNGADGIILIFDITNKKSFEKISFWIQDLSNKIDLDNTCLILIGNKTDLKDQRKVSVEEAQKYAAQYNIEYYEVSALKNVGIIEMMEFFIKKCYNNMKEKNNYSITISKDGMNYYSKKKCC